MQISLEARCFLEQLLATYIIQMFALHASGEKKGN